MITAICNRRLLDTVCMVQSGDDPPREVSAEEFVRRALNTKVPRFFTEGGECAESIRSGAITRRWIRFMGDISVAVDVEVFDDADRNNPQVHRDPFDATLVFVSGACFPNNIDSEELIDPYLGEVERGRLLRFYARRLLPALRFISTDAKARGVQAAVRMPMLGCGQFAGEHRDSLIEMFPSTVLLLFSDHRSELEHIESMNITRYEVVRGVGAHTLMRGSCVDNVGSSIDAWAQMTTSVHINAMPPLSKCFVREGIRLYSIVAADPLAFPGNDYWDGVRCTDEGNKAAATNLMSVISGIEGRYDRDAHAYYPKSCWKNTHGIWRYHAPPAPFSDARVVLM